MERSDTMIKLTLCPSDHSKPADFTSLTGDVFDIISEYLPDSRVPPRFTLVNSQVLSKYAKYKKENFAIQNEILVD